MRPEGGNHCSPTPRSPHPLTPTEPLAAARFLSRARFITRQVTGNRETDDGWRGGTKAAGHPEILRESVRRW